MFSKYHLNLGNSSLKSLHVLGVHSLSARILATISLPCHFPLHNSPDGLIAIFVCNARSTIFIPLCLDNVGSPRKL